MDNMNNGMMGGPNPTMGGYNYQGMNQPMQKHGNVLSNEQIKSLQQKQQQFSLALTQEEYLRAVCNHRNMDGTGDTLVYDPETGEARRIDFVVIKDKKVIDSIEVTSKTADKTVQSAKEARIRDIGGNYVRDNNGNLVKIPFLVQTRIERRD